MTHAQVAGPVMKELLENVLPYMKIDKVYNEKELDIEETREITVPNLINIKIDEAKAILNEQKIKFEIEGSGDTVRTQFPPSNEVINFDGKIILYTN